MNFQTVPNVDLIVVGLKMAAVSHLKNKKEARMRGKLDKVGTITMMWGKTVSKWLLAEFVFVFVSELTDLMWNW